MYSGRFPPGTQFEMSWKGLVVIPRRGKTFGCAKCFHVTASLQKSWLSLVMTDRKVRASKTHLDRVFLNVLGIHLDPFYADIRTTKGSLVHIARTSWSEWCGIDFQKLRRKCVRCW